jgi:uncharacterized membrane protein YgaE (UPF0421/DUF939 family)
MSPFTFQKLSVLGVGYGLALALASVMAYEASSVITPVFLHASADAVDKLWAIISAVFVFRDTRANSLSAGTSRLIATFVSFLLCLIYLSCLPAHPLGMMALIAIGTPIMMLLERRSDIGLTAITTAVIMILATSKPQNAWQEPLLRLIDTVAGGWSVSRSNGSHRFCSTALPAKRCDDRVRPNWPNRAQPVHLNLLVLCRTRG